MNIKKQWTQQLINSSHIGILVVDKERNNLFVNDHLCKLVGYDREFLLQSNAEIFHVSHETFLNFAELAFNSVLAGKPLGIDYQVKRRDGSRFWVHISGDPIGNSEVLWTFIDITEKIEANTQLKLLKERMELALLGNNDGVWDWDLQSNNVYFSPRWKEIIGYEDSELPNEFATWQERAHKDDVQNVLTDIQNHIDKKSDYVDNIHRMQHKDGHWVWIHDRAKAIFDANGKAIRMIGTHTDISVQKAIELKLEQQAQMIEQIHDSVISADLDGIITSFNHGSNLLLEYTTEEIVGKHISTLYLQEDTEKFAKIIEELTQNGESHSEVCFVKKSGKTIEVDLSLSLLKDELGNPTGMVGYAQDITSRKEAEKELQNQYKYLQSIIDGVDDPIMVIKEDYSIELMNATLKESAKHIELEDPNSPKCYEISHHRTTPCDGLSHPCPLKEVLQTKKHTTVVHNHATQNGENRFVELSATPLLDKDKNCIGIIEAARDITKHLQIQEELRTQKQTLDHQAHHDALTGLPNRVLFNDRLIQSIEKTKRKENKFALLFIDLDHFKEINDSLGHAIGDDVLQVAASRLTEAVRSEDSVARLGGDEFTVILENLTEIEDASSIADKIIKTLSEPMYIKEHTLYVSSSVGISVYPDDGESAQDLLKYADSAMYKAKDEGRNNYQYYNATMTALAFQRVSMEASLRAALQNEEFIVYYQPQIDGRTDKVIGMEALVRWLHPTMGLVSPDKFIPLAESTGLIVQIDRFVMKTAMTQVTKWYKEGLNPGVLAMNLAVKQLKQKDFIEVLEKLMLETECMPECIELEVTESQIMTNPQEAIKSLQEISKLGISLAVDDFGTGYSSLSYLKKLPIDKLKIDQAFIRDLPDDEDDVGITKAVIALAKSLNLRVIAEGVETQEQRDFLVENDCPNIQGYFYSKPIDASEFTQMLKKH